MIVKQYLLSSSGLAGRSRLIIKLNYTGWSSTVSLLAHFVARSKDKLKRLTLLSPGNVYLTARMTKGRNGFLSCHLERNREISSFIFTKQPAAVIPTRIAGQSEYQGSLFIKPLRTLAKTSFGEFLLPLLSMGEGGIRCSAGALPLNVITRKFKISRLRTEPVRQPRAERSLATSAAVPWHRVAV